MTEDLKKVLITNGLPVLFVLIGLIAAGIGWRNRKKYKHWWLLGFALGGAGVIDLFVQSVEFRNILVAFASIAAVMISVISINQNAQTRADSFERERRDRNDQLLNEILDWVKRVGSCPWDVNLDEEIFNNILNGTLDNSSTHKFLNKHRETWRNKYKDVSWQNAYILNIATRFGKELFNRVNELTDRLKKYEKCWQD